MSGSAKAVISMRLADSFFRRAFVRAPPRQTADAQVGRRFSSCLAASSLWIYGVCDWLNMAVVNALTHGHLS
jgi:hypothetical protein